MPDLQLITLTLLYPSPGCWQRPWVGACWHSDSRCKYIPGMLWLQIFWIQICQSIKGDAFACWWFAAEQNSQISSCTGNFFSFQIVLALNLVLPGKKPNKPSKHFSGEVRTSATEKMKCMVRCGMVWGSSSFPVFRGIPFPFGSSTIWHPGLRWGRQYSMLWCELHRICELCQTSGSCRSWRWWHRWGGIYMRTALSFSVNFFFLCVSWHKNMPWKSSFCWQLNLNWVFSVIISR